MRSPRPNIRRAMLSLPAAISALLYAKAPLAQELEPVIGEVVVTATRRAEKLTDVPYNISAVTSEQLDRSGIDDLGRLSHAVAGLAYIDQGPRSAGNNNGLVLRGLNSNATRATDAAFRSVAPVSTYLGETPLFFNLKLFDLERVEVLRGPQGTLYGSGSLGGTVRFIPKLAQLETFEARAEAGMSDSAQSGELNHDAQGMINVPIGQNVALRVAGGYEHQGGFIDEKRLAELDQSGTPRITGPVLDPTTTLVRRTVRDSNEADIYFGRAELAVRLGERVNASLHYNYQRSEIANRQADNPRFPGNRSYEGSSGVLSPQDARTDVSGFDIEADLGFATLTSATSYYDTDSKATTSDAGVYQLFLADAYYFGYPRFVVPGRTVTTDRATVQELRLASQGESAIDWLVGAFYQDQRSSFSLVDAEDKGLTNYVAALDPFNAYYGVPTPSIAGFDLFTQSLRTRFRDRALFGELTWHVTPRWQITGGARAFWQKVESSQSFALPACEQLTFCGPPSSIADSRKESDQIFRANTSYQVNDHTKLYFTWAEGFRHGGANALPPPGTPQADPRAPLQYRSDRSTNWELGIKGTLPRVDLTYALAAFYIEWDDFQFDSFTSYGYQFVGNGATASSRGIEAELSGLLTDRLSYSLSYSYADAQLDQPFALVTRGNDGDPLPGVPKQTASAALEYAHPIGDSWELTYHVGGSYRDKAYSNFNPTGLSYFEMDSFALWDASITLAAAQRWEARLFADNLSNERGVTGGTTPDRFGDEAYFQVMRPRTIGLRVKVNFD